MDDRVAEFVRNGGICDDCLREIATGKMEINAPVEQLRSTYNFQHVQTRSQK